MASNNRFNFPFFQSINASTSAVGAGWKLYFYEAGATTTLKDTYSDVARTIANANPVVADANGRWGDIFLQDILYNVLLHDANDVLVDSTDNVGRVADSTLVSLRTSVVTIAEMTADTSAVVGDFYMVWDYTSGNRSPVMFFEGVAAGTGTDNGLDYIDHDTLSVQFRQILPAVYSQRYGGNAVTDPAPVDITDLQTIEQAAGDLAMSIARAEASLAHAKRYQDEQLTAFAAGTLTAPIAKPEMFGDAAVGNICTAHMGVHSGHVATSYVTHIRWFPERDGEYRIDFSFKSSSGVSAAWARIYVNAVAVGTAYSTTSTTYSTASAEDFIVSKGDTVALLTHGTSGAKVTVGKFQVYQDISTVIQTAAESLLAEP